MNRPSPRMLSCLLAALAVVALTRPASADPRALDEATESWRALSKDAERREFRHHWKRVIEGLESASRGHDACSWTQLALMRAALASEELSTISFVSEDMEVAAKKFVVAARSCAKGRLADDAFLAAARLQARLGDVEGQRASLQSAIEVKGDMRDDARRALAKLPPPPKRESEALVDATERFERMKSNRRLRYYRHNWLAAVRRFERAGDALAPARDGAIAFMRGAKASEEVSRISKRPEDARKAIELYVEAADRCPSQSLVDDALIEAASLELNRFGDTRAARAHLQRAIAFGGDMKSEARRLLSTLPPPKKAPAKKKPATVAKKAPEPEPSEHEHAHDEEVLSGEPVSPDALLEATFAHVEGPAAADLGALMEQVDQITLERERTTAKAKVKELKQEALGGEWSISEQLGAKVRRIVLDAGHGGHDSGAVGPTGVKEKDVTLQMTKRLAKMLRARGYEVVLTRDDDTFIALEDRTRMANAARGDLFISIHANAHTSRRQNGIETYALNVASDRFAMRLAARENASTEQSVSDLQFLLADLAARANTADSDRLASFVQENLVSSVRREHGKVRDRGVKHALFYVLLGARMPAILVETAFVSNKREEKWLSSSGFQKTVADAVADGVDQFVQRRQKLASVR